MNLSIRIPLILTLLLTHPNFAQSQYLTVSGTALDRRTNEPLPYATISVTRSAIGTVSNEAGEFTLSVPTKHANDSLMISHVGYGTIKRKIAELKAPQSFYLDETPTVLNEIVVSGESARTLVQKAIQVIPRLFPNEPYLLEGFHRSWETIHFTDSVTYPGTLIEAAVTVYDPGYDRKRETIYVNEIRRSAIMKGWDYGGNSLQQLLQENLVRYHQTEILYLKSFLDFPNNLTYTWEGTTQIDDEPVHIVNAKVTSNIGFSAIYRAYISEADNAILRFELCGTDTAIDFTRPWHTDSVRLTYIFKRFADKPYLRYAKRQYTIKKLDTTHKKVLQTETYFREFLVNNVITTNVAARRKALGTAARPNSFALQARPYNEAFWQHYNGIQENPLDREVIELFEQHGKLKNQFRAKQKR